MTVLTDDQLRELALQTWRETTSWDLSRDDFIRLSYFHGCMDNGSDGKGPINGSEDRPGDVVYKDPNNGGVLTRHLVTYWLNDCSSFLHGFTKGYRKAEAKANEQLNPKE